MQDYERDNILEQYEIAVNSTRKTRGAILCSTDKGVFLMREVGVSEKRLPALIELYEYFMDYGYQTIDMPVKNREGDYVTKGFDGSIYMLRRMPPGRECDVRRAAELFEAAKEKGVFLMEAYAYLHSPFVTALKKEIEEGTIGEIRYIESQFLTSYYDKSNIRLHKENYGGAVYDLGCYNTSMLLKLLEDMPSRVKAMAQYDENGVDVYTAALLNYENDVRASITCGMIFEKDKPHRYDRLYIHGTKGDIKSDTEFNQEGNASYTLIIEGKEQIRNVYCPHNYQLEIEQLGRCIIEGETPVVTADFSIKNAKILDAILQEIGYFESNVM